MGKLQMPTKYADCNLSVGHQHISSILEELTTTGAFPTTKFKIYGNKGAPSEKDIRTEESQLMVHPIERASLGFERTRDKIRPLLQAIVRAIFHSLSLDPIAAIDIGSGATSEMWARLIPERLKTHFKQVELNPAAVQAVKTRYPEADIEIGSYHELEKVKDVARESIDLITGLSTLDATFYPESAVASIASVLKSGKYFVHVQDVRPGEGVAASEVEKIMKEKKWDLKDLDVILHQDRKIQIGYRFPEEGLVSTAEIFRRRMNRVFNANHDFELVFNDWIVARKVPNERQGIGLAYVYYQNMLLLAHAEEDEVSAVVTIARKKT